MRIELAGKSGDLAGAIPLRGLGTFHADAHSGPSGTVKQAVLGALETGYRHIDTAWAYGNGQSEREIGEAIRESNVPRDEIYIVTKLPNTFHKPEDVGTALEMSLSNMGLDYVDLYLMHNAYAYAADENHDAVRREDGSGKPLIDVELSKAYPETYEAMKKLKASGKARAIGVSNFNIIKLKRLIEVCGVPAANQIEMNPYFPQPELVAFCKSHNIQVIAHCPLGGALDPRVAGRAGDGPLNDLLINYIAERHHITAAQVMLAWMVSQGIAVVPKSDSIKRIRENFDVAFPLSPAEQQLINTMTFPNTGAQRNMVSAGHIGFDTFDEEQDLPN